MGNGKIKRAIFAFVFAFVFALGSFSNFTVKNVKADNAMVEYKLSEELAKLTEIGDLEQSVVGVYSSVYWCGPYLQWTYQSLDGTADSGIANYSKIEVSESVSITPSGTNAGTNSVFSYTGNHSVGSADCGDADRTWAIGFIAPKNGSVTVKAVDLKVTGVLNSSNLKIGVSKGARTHIRPQDASLNWQNYPAVVGEQYVIGGQTFAVSKGEMVFINLYAESAQDVQPESEKYVKFTCDPVFEFTPAPDTLHSFNHMQKLTRDENGALINNVTLTLDDETTYPFSYLYRSTAGYDNGVAGQEHAMPVAEMTKASVSIDPTGLRLFAPETYSGFLETGVIVNVSRSPDPMNVILGFTSPYEGELKISDIALNYGYYPNNTNGYKDVNGRVHDTAYKGLAFRIMLNGKQVWPINGGWDKSLANLYQSATDGYAVGDLIKSQRTNDISGIKVKKYDQVYFELTRADLNTTEDCDTIEFNPTFTVDTTADMSDYVLYTTASDYFDIINTNDSESTISYWAVNTKNGLYNRATYSLMGAIDYSSLTYTSDILEDNASDIGWNYFRPKTGEDCAMTYLVGASGNLTISAETVFRGGNMALWEVFDLIYKGSMISTDGVRMRIEINGERAWPQNSAWEEYKPRSEKDINGCGVFNFEPVTLGVTAGDSVTIRINAGESHLYDGFNFNPVFALSETSNPVTNPAVTPDPSDDSVNGGGGNGGNSNGSLLPVILIVVGVVVVFGAVMVVMIIKKNKQTELEASENQNGKQTENTETEKQNENGNQTENTETENENENQTET